MSKIKIIYANTWVKQAIGLIRHKKLDKNEVLCLPNCRSIHTHFMRFPIDVIFVNQDGMILKLTENLKPFRICLGPKKTARIYEACEGFIKRYNLKIGKTMPS